MSEVFLRKNAVKCANHLCKAVLHFEVMGSMRIKRLHPDGRYYYSAICPNKCSLETFKVTAPPEPKDEDARVKPLKLDKPAVVAVVNEPPLVATEPAKSLLSDQDIESVIRAQPQDKPFNTRVYARGIEAKLMSKLAAYLRDQPKS